MESNFPFFSYCVRLSSVIACFHLFDSIIFFLEQIQRLGWVFKEVAMTCTILYPKRSLLFPFYILYDVTHPLNLCLVSLGKVGFFWRALYICAGSLAFLSILVNSGIGCWNKIYLKNVNACAVDFYTENLWQWTMTNT